MKGTRKPTVEEKALHDRMAREIGCIACLKDCHKNTWVSIHHIEGRTKEGCHMLVLPLCGVHHQHDDTDPLQRIGIHPYKARFEAKYGAQHDLLEEVYAALGLVNKKARAA